MMLEVKGAAKAFGKQRALSNINWQVSQGDFWGVIGPNGSGKSTLLNLLSGIESPDQGDVLLKGRPVKSYRRKELSKRLAVLQQDGLPPVSFTVREVIEMGRYPFQDWRGTDRDENAESILEDIMHRLDLNSIADRPLSSLSGGQRQRAALGKVMAQQPEVILLDEPTTFLDIRYQMQFMELVEAWREREGLTVIAVMHDLNLAALYCSSLVVLNHGEIAASGSPGEILKPDLIQHIFAVNSYSIHHPDHGEPQLLYRRGLNQTPGDPLTHSIYGKRG